jgi:hypothetical protein
MGFSIHSAPLLMKIMMMSAEPLVARNVRELAFLKYVYSLIEITFHIITVI